MYTSLYLITPKFFGENISNSDRLCTCLGHLGWCHTDRIISMCVVLPLVAKASAIRVAVAGVIVLSFANGNAAFVKAGYH